MAEALGYMIKVFPDRPKFVRADMGPDSYAMDLEFVLRHEGTIFSRRKDAEKVEKTINKEHPKWHTYIGTVYFE